MAELAAKSILDRILVLRSLPSFAALDDDAAAWVAEHGRMRRFEPGDVLSEEGEAVTHAHIVTDGCIRATRKDRVADVRRGSGVGFLSVLARDEHGIRAEAIETSTTLELPVETLISAYEENFSLLRGALRNLSRSLLKARGNLPRRPAENQDDLPPMGTRRSWPSTLVERILVMRERGLFMLVNLDAVIDVARRLEPVSFEPGASIWRIGDVSDFSLRIRYGRVRCTEGSGATAMIGAEFVLGAMEVLSDEPRRYAAVAETEVQGYRLGRDTFLSVVEAHPRVGLDLAGILARSLLEET